MTPDDQFWWTWWVRLAQAAFTLLAVIVALGGERLKRLWFKPDLHLEFESPVGETTRVGVRPPGGGPRQDAAARYYHVRLSNRARWWQATHAQVLLLRVMEAGPAGALQTTWSGEIPVSWAWAPLYPPQRTVGPDARCDLCSVVEGSGLYVHLAAEAAAFDAFRHRPIGQPVDMTLVLQARANEGDSEITAFQISWDGKWEAGAAEMARHTVIQKVAMYNRESR